MTFFVNRSIWLFVLSTFLLMRPISTQAQEPVSFSQFPSHLQFFARESNDSAVVSISGLVLVAGFDTVRVDQYRDSLYWRSTSASLTYKGATALFLLRPTIYATPVEFGFRMYLVHQGVDYLVGARDSIICGDAFLITGQSNATPGDNTFLYTNEFCRSFGSQNDYAPYDPADTNFGLATASGPFQGEFHTGIWGLELQRHILETYHIPTCIINGAVGGSIIEQDVRNDTNPTDLSSIYGKTLYRARKSGLDTKFKAQFWYQGESNAWTNYNELFRELYDDWHNDFPAEQKLYLVQIRPGCGWKPSHGVLRDYQRTVGDSLAGIEAVSSVAIEGHQGCHYEISGYTRFAAQLFRQVSRDFYSSSDTIALDPPNISFAAFSNKQHSEITLVFRGLDSLVWPAKFFDGMDSMGLETAFLLDSIPGLITSGRVEGNHLILTLSGPSSAQFITYVPPVYYPQTTSVYEGPWITNRRGVGALTFNDVQILDSLAEGAILAENFIPRPVQISSILTGVASTRVKLTLGASAEVLIQLSDELGRILFKGSEQLSRGDQTVNLPTANLSSGVYFCKFSTHDGWDSGKFEIVH
jgi:hypothetical protein